MPDFGSHKLVEQVWAATSGRPSFITLLLQKAVLSALNGQRTSITVSDLATAFDSGVTIDVAQSTKNPFEMLNYELKDSVLSKLRGQK